LNASSYGPLHTVVIESGMLSKTLGFQMPAGPIRVTRRPLKSNPFFQEFSGQHVAVASPLFFEPLKGRQPDRLFHVAPPNELKSRDPLDRTGFE
jgi:hypothetical protein